jgi:adenosylmethionine-8-amino-7-oxononanoate aminotransferase
MSRVLHRTVRADPPVVTHGEGLFLHLRDGRTILDGSGGAAVSCLGHNHPRVVEAIAAQVARHAYAATTFFSSEPAEALAEILLDDEPGGLSHAYFVSSGSEGVEAALKLARQYFLEIGQPQRHHFIARRQGYHGNTLGALAAGGNMMRRAPYDPLLSAAFSLVSPCFTYRFQQTGESDTAYVQRLAEELDAEFQRVGPDSIAAFCAETVVGATAGCVTALPGYFPAMRAVCDRHGALLILDEVMCGMGRTGTLHAWQQEAVFPDIQVIAKGLAGGYQPLGAVLIGRKIIDALRMGSGSFMHGHTYQAHPIACAAGLAVQQVIREENLLQEVVVMGAHLEQALQERFGNHRHVGDIRGRGLFRALEFVSDRGSRAPFAPEQKLHERIKAAAFAVGLTVYPMGGTIDGARGDHVIISPAYIAKPDDIDLIVARLGQAVDAVLPG